MTNAAESSEITTQPPRAEITRELVQPPSRVYMTLNDQLYIRTRNSLTGVVLRIAGRLLTPNGEIVPFQFTHTPATNRSSSLEAFQLAEGYLLSAVVFATSGAPVRGQTFVELGFLRGIVDAGSIVDVLVKDYVAANRPIAFPGSPIRSSLEGPGALRSITGTDPAAGVQISETVPTNARWRYMSMQASLVTSATAGNRRHRIRFDDGTTEFYSNATNTVQNPSTTVDIVFGPMGEAESVSGAIYLVPTPEMLFLSAGFRIRTDPIQFQVDDDWGAPQLLVEEWLED